MHEMENGVPTHSTTFVATGGQNNNEFSPTFSPVMLHINVCCPPSGYLGYHWPPYAWSHNNKTLSLEQAFEASEEMQDLEEAVRVHLLRTIKGDN
jgi:hypothetical protein